ncbi:MAG: glycoside hydrolase family 52 protein [Opitutaceae bacterium]
MPNLKTSRSEHYHAQHSPLGAFASFTVGLPENTGGFGYALRGPANQNVYVGFRESGGKPWRLLPFFKPQASLEGTFTGEAASVRSNPHYRPLTARQISRSLGWASDTWSTRDGRFSFSLLSPFGETPDPAGISKEEARLSFSPHINGWIEMDNRKGKDPVELILGVGDPDRLFRPLEDARSDLKGFACGTEFGFATPPSSRAEARQGFDIFNPNQRDHRGLLLIGGECGLVFTVAAGKKRRFPLVLGFFQNGCATTGIETTYAYTKWFANLEEVLAHGLSMRTHYERLAARRDRELERSGLTADQKFLIAQGTHSYLGNSQLLWNSNGPLYVVNEGEYRMMNTFDLAVDQMFFELCWFPWAVRNILDQFVARYSYEDRVKLSPTRSAPGGLSFTHDMGVMNNFTPKGYSSYECVELTGCFSQMTMEQLLNWVLTAITYAIHTNDIRWLKKQEATLLACAESIRRRDHPIPAKRDGIMKFDSSRCGKTGAEITTYDSLDVSLGQARNNLYLVVKTLGAWILLEAAFKRLRRPGPSRDARKSAGQLAQTLIGKFSEEDGCFPAVFENNNTSRIIPAIEGFLYPLFLGLRDATDRRGRFADLHDRLARHLRTILRKGVCLDATSGGWKMSSTSTNTWFSKIALSQHIIRSIYPETMSRAAARADSVHAEWQRQAGCGAFAMCDQIRSDSGITCGSRYYPRGVTAVLWMNETKTTRRQ